MARRQSAVGKVGAHAEATRGDTGVMADLSLPDAPMRVGPATLRGRVFVPAHQPGLAEGGVPGPRYIASARGRASPRCSP